MWGDDISVWWYPLISSFVYFLPYFSVLFCSATILCQRHTACFPIYYSIISFSKRPFNASFAIMIIIPFRYFSYYIFVTFFCFLHFCLLTYIHTLHCVISAYFIWLLHLNCIFTLSQSSSDRRNWHSTMNDCKTKLSM